MFANTTQNQHIFRPPMRVVHGSTFDGAPYQIALEDDEVGLGSSARIRKGHISGSFSAPVAVKVFGELLSRTKQQLLVRELHFAREVSCCHRYILEFLGTATLGEQTAIVSLYMENGNLIEYITAYPDCDKKTLILQVAKAVEFLHVNKKLVHGDLKCENVLVSDAGNALLADFGLSSFIEKSETLSTTITAIRQMHTVQFAAPELLGVPEDAGNWSLSQSEEDDPPISKKTTGSDVYAFGMLILQAISEEPPWGDKNHNAIIRSLSAGHHPPRPTLDGTFVAMSQSWWNICRSCWKFRSRERPQISDVLRTLEATQPEPNLDLPIYEDAVTAAYMPDGETILAASAQSIIHFNTASGHKLRLPHRTNADLGDDIVGLAFSPSRQYIAYCSGQTVEVLHVAFGVPVKSMQHDGFPACVAYSQDGSLIASGTTDGTIQLWSADTCVAFGQHLQGHTGAITAVSFSPTGLHLASASDDGTMRLWDCRTFSLVEILSLRDLSDHVYAMEFSRDGRHIVAGDHYGMVIIATSASSDKRGRTPRISNWRWGTTISVAFSPSGKYVAAGGMDGEIRFWDVHLGTQVVPPLRGHSDAVLSVAFSPDGKSIVSSSDDGKIRVWDLFD